MTDNAPANWYPQPDGSQRYWDGSQWTEHIVPAAPPAPPAPPAPAPEPAHSHADPASVAHQSPGEPGSAADPSGAVPVVPVVPAPGQSIEGAGRPWWKKKRVLIPGGALVALIGISAVGAATGGGPSDNEAAASPSPTVAEAAASPEPTEAPVVVTMPDVVGANLQDAQDSLQALGSYLLDQQDATGDGRLQLVDANWTVCTQEPAAGADFPVDATVILAAVKLDEACPGDEPADADRADADQAEEKDASEKPSDDGQGATVSQANARESAESYLAFSAFSRTGLIEQLEYEGYAVADAEYAVDAVGADWSEQAAKSAESYLDFSAFSYSGLVEQLEYEGFTSKQATFGADAVDADWNEQAVKSAESYLDFTSFSRAGLIDQLKYEGFSTEQATHAVNEVGL